MKTLLLFLLFCTIAHAEVVIDTIKYNPCQQECTAHIYKTPDDGKVYAPKEGPRLDLVNAGFSEGDYKIIVCGDTPNAASDSIYVGIDDSVVAVIDLKSWLLNRFKCTSDLQDGGEAIVPITKGIHTVNLWAREDGLVVTDFKMEKQ